MKQVLTFYCPFKYLYVFLIIIGICSFSYSKNICHTVEKYSYSHGVGNKYYETKCESLYITKTGDLHIDENVRKIIVVLTYQIRNISQDILNKQLICKAIIDNTLSEEDVQSLIGKNTFVTDDQSEINYFTTKYGDDIRQHKHLKCQYKESNRFIDISQNNKLTYLELNPHIIGSKMPDGRTILKRFVPDLSFDPIPSTNKYSFMVENYKYMERVDELLKVLQIQKSQMDKLEEKLSKLNKVISKIEKNNPDKKLIKKVYKKFDSNILLLKYLEAENQALSEEMSRNHSYIDSLQEKLSKYEEEIIKFNHKLNKCIQNVDKLVGSDGRPHSPPPPPPPPPPSPPPDCINSDDLPPSPPDCPNSDDLSPSSSDDLNSDDLPPSSSDDLNSDNLPPSSDEQNSDNLPPSSDEQNSDDLPPSPSDEQNSDDLPPSPSDEQNSEDLSAP